MGIEKELITLAMNEIIALEPKMEVVFEHVPRGLNMEANALLSMV